MSSPGPPPSTLPQRLSPAACVVVSWLVQCELSPLHIFDYISLLIDLKIPSDAGLPVLHTSEPPAAV
jgi:hypothetical protein